MLPSGTPTRRTVMSPDEGTHHPFHAIWATQCRGRRGRQVM